MGFSNAAEVDAAAAASASAEQLARIADALEVLAVVGASDRGWTDSSGLDRRIVSAALNRLRKNVAQRSATAPEARP